MDLFKKSNIFHDEIKCNSKSSKTKNKFNKTVFLDKSSKLSTITSYTVHDNGNSYTGFTSLKNISENNNIKSLYRLYKDNSDISKDYIKNKTNNLFFLRTFNSKLRKKNIHTKNNLNSLKKVNLEIFDKKCNLYNKIKRTFSHNLEKIKKKKNNSYFSTFPSNDKKIDLNKSINAKKNNYNANNTDSYIYNDTIHMKFSKSLYKYKYIKQSLYLVCLRNMNNKKNIFNLTPEEYNGKNILLSPLNSNNYNKEIKNLGKRFITNDIVSFKNSKLNLINRSINSKVKKEEHKEVNNLLNKPCFIEKVVSYKILNQVKFSIKSPSERSKCKNFINNFNSFVCINKL